LAAGSFLGALICHRYRIADAFQKLCQLGLIGAAVCAHSSQLKASVGSFDLGILGIYTAVIQKPCNTNSHN
jgi:hypothetical protein